jgi:hypothetical protein
VCEQEGLLGGTFFAIDGCKMPTNASKEWSGKFSELHKRKEKIEDKIKVLVEDHIEKDKEENTIKGQTLVNREKQIKRLQQQAEKIEKWLAENEKKIGSNGKELRSNITDNDSTKMRQQWQRTSEQHNRQRFYQDVYIARYGSGL